jgi:2,4-dienoyl-CoA reductase-like NADH-dependent reductase (Old Yellow Enzyme family)
VIEIINAVRQAVGPEFPVGIRMNSTDQLEGGLTEDDALEFIHLLDKTSIDLIDISGGTYFPGAKASSDGTSDGPYFINFAPRAKQETRIPLMVTGGFKKSQQAIDALASGAIDMVGLGRAMALNPTLANDWLSAEPEDPKFPIFKSTVPGAITAWFTLRLTAIGENLDNAFDLDLPDALSQYDERDNRRCIEWKKVFEATAQ